MGVSVVDTRLSLIYAKEPCAESLALGAISADSFRSFSFCFFFLMPVLSTWFSVLVLKGTTLHYVLLVLVQKQFYVLVLVLRAYARGIFIEIKKAMNPSSKKG